MAFKSIRKRTAQKRLTFKEVIKQEFDYDVDDLDPYVDEQSPEIMEDLINASNLKSRVSVMDNVKGSKLIKIKTSQPTLQAAEACGWTPEGGIVLTDVTLSTVRLKIQEEYCNEDLNDTWAQIENIAGANAQDESAPNFASTMIAFYVKTAQKMDQDLMFKGDTTSLNGDLAHYDGFLKRWKADANVIVYQSGETAITRTNAFDIALALYNKIPAVLLDNQTPMEIGVGRETYRFIIEAIYDDNNFHHTLTEEAGSEPSFLLPTTNIRVRCYSQLTGTNEMVAMPYEYMFYGTDLEGDINGFQFKYDDTEELLRFSVKWRSGIAYVFPQYFTRLRLLPS